MLKDLFEQVPQLMEDLKYEIARHDLDCSDNYRAAIKGDYDSEQAYNAISERGCCGRFDTTTEVDGVLYLIGCNYGH